MPDKTVKKYLSLHLPSVLLLLLLMLLGGLYSVWLGIDVNFDLLNYHLYNPYALLNGKIGQDVFAAGVHSALNPLPDVYLYGLFSAFFNSPKWIGFFMGLPYGVLIWLVYRLARDVFSRTQYPKTYAAVAAFIGCSAAGIMSQVGTSTNEIPLAVFHILAFWLLLRAVQQPQKTYGVYMAALLSGATAGLKLTGASCCVALTAVLLVYLTRFKKPGKVFMLYALCGILGFLLTNGYFMWQNFTLYGNPVFPYYNTVFHSPYFDNVNVTETRFFPTTWAQWLFYPFFWAFAPGTYVSEAPVQDSRLALFLAALAGWGILIAKNKLGGVKKEAAVSVAVYSGVGYVVWLVQFSILRYAAVLEALCGLVVVGVCAAIHKTRWGVYAALLCVGISMWGYQAPDWHHEMFLEQAVIFDKKPKIEDNSLVFFMHLPSSYLAPLLNPKAVYIGGFLSKPEEYPKQFRRQAAQRNNISAQYYRFRFEELQRDKIARHQGPIYIVSVDWPMIVNPATLARFGLKGKREDCQRFVTNFTVYSKDLAICRVQKIDE